MFRAAFLHCLRFDVLEAGPDGSSARLYAGALASSALAAIVGLHVVGDGASGVGLLYALTALFGFLGLVSELGWSLVDPRDLALLDTTPAPARLYFAARFSAASVGLLLRVLAFGLVPGILLGWETGLWWAPVAHLIALTAMFLAMAGIAVGLWLVLQRLADPAWVRDLLIWLQVALFVVATAGWLWLFRGDPGDEGVMPLKAVVNSNLFPSRWFADLYGCMVGGAWSGGGVMAAGGLLAVVAGGLVLASSHYGALLRRVEAGTSRARPPRRGLGDALERSWIPAQERPGFRLGLRLLRRERTFRLQTYPLLAYPVLFLAMGGGRDDGGLFAILFTHLASLYLPIVAAFLRYSDTPAAAWTMRLHRVGSISSIERGARKALVVAVVAPLFLVVGVTLAFDRGVAFALGHGGLAGALATFIVVRGVPSTGTLPFSSRFQGGIQTQGELAMIYPLFALVILSAAVQFGLERAVPLAVPIVAVGALALVARTLRKPVAEADDAALVDEVAEVGTSSVGHAEPFPVRLRREVRGLAVFHLVLAGFGMALGWVTSG